MGLTTRLLAQRRSSRRRRSMRTSLKVKLITSSKRNLQCPKK